VGGKVREKKDMTGRKKKMRRPEENCRESGQFDVGGGSQKDRKKKEEGENWKEEKSSSSKNPQLRGIANVQDRNLGLGKREVKYG